MMEERKTDDMDLSAGTNTVAVVICRQIKTLGNLGGFLCTYI
jgi:predicted PolB exonuclease-like 3'-5' exonuclease